MTEMLFRLQNPSCAPITFTSHSIERIAAGHKTQTRRTMYPQPEGEVLVQDPKSPRHWHLKNDPKQRWRCPYGEVGDRLWVRQVWARIEPFPNVLEDFRMPVPWRVEKNPVLLHYWRQRVIFLSDFPGKKPEECGRGATDNVWRSPGTMPRWAARDRLEVTEIRTERLQEISADDAFAEGVESAEARRHRHGDFSPGALGYVNYGPRRGYNFETPQESFATLWDALNGRQNPWAANCWVWVISFRRLDECAA
jgi:hypothetical protein